MKCPSEHLLFENQQICFFKSFNSPSSDDLLTPSQLPCLSVPESSVHVYVALSSGVPCTHEDADYRSSDFFRPSISYHHALSCRCRLSLLCVGHLRILPGAPPQDAGLEAGVSQYHSPAPCTLRSRLLHPLATELTDTGSTRQTFWQLCNKETLSFVFSCQ